MREFSHCCAICGTANPQIHHIDGDHTNNDPLNLLPLCPNCHLTDQHNPTRPMNPARILLFRRFKDPAILTPQFEPLFDRLRFLDSLDAGTADESELASRAGELVGFVAALEMGAFYSKQIDGLVGRPPRPFAWSGSTTDEEIRRQCREDLTEYVGQLSANREEVHRLSVELLRYQDWLPAEKRSRA